MQYVPNESANVALAIALNLMDALVSKGALTFADRSVLLHNAVRDLAGNTVANNDARRVIREIAQGRYDMSLPE